MGEDLIIAFIPYMFCLLFIYSLYSLCIYLYVRKHLCSLLILLIYSFGPIAGLVKLTMCAKVCHVNERMFILLIGQTELKTTQSRTHPINRSTWIQVAACNIKISCNVHFHKLIVLFLFWSV